jgi:hypothetical protein
MGEYTVANSALGIKPKTNDCIKDGRDQRQAGMGARENSSSKRRNASEKRPAERMIANRTWTRAELKIGCRFTKPAIPNCSRWARELDKNRECFASTAGRSFRRSIFVGRNRNESSENL